MRYLLSIFFLFFCLSAFSQVDRIELGYQSTKRGIEWTRPGLPTHVPVWRVSRDTNTIIWHDKNTGMRYDWDYLTSVWYARGRFSSALPPLPTQTSGLATIDNRTGFYLNASNILHRYDITQTAWVPLKLTYQSAAPTNVASGVSNGAAIYTTTLWQDSDDFLIRYWDGDSWELIGGGNDLTFSGASSPVTLNSSTGADVTFTAGTGISLAGTSTDLTISGTAAGLSKWTDAGAFTYLTSTTDNAVIGASTQASSGRLEVSKSYSNTSDANIVAVGNIPLIGWRTTSANRYAMGTGYEGNGIFTLLGSTTAANPTTELMSWYGDGSLVNSNTLQFLLPSGKVNAVGAGSSFGASSAPAGVDFYAAIASGQRFRIQGAAGLSYMDFYTPASGSNRNFSFATSYNSAGDFNLLQSSTAGGTPGTGIFQVDINSNICIGCAGAARKFQVAGEVRITDLTTDTPTRAVGADADGDLGELALSGMSISAGTLTATDGSITNELQTLAHTSNSTSHTATLSNSGGSLQIIEGAGVLLTTGGTGLNGTVTIEAIDPSTTNEIQTYSASGAGPTSYDMTVSSGGTVTLAEGAGIDLTRSGNTITVASTATSGYVNGGNSFGGAATIGLNDNFDWAFETNGTTRGWIDNAGTYTIGSAILTTAALNISGLQNGIGMHVAGGTGLVSPVMLQTRGNGSGSTVLVLDAQHSFLNGNVEALIQNTSTSGSGGVVMELNAKTATGDPRLYITIDGTTDWSLGIDNDDVDNLKLHRFAAPSDNNGEGTIEFGYDGTMIGMGINKTGIGTATNGYYALDIFGKTRADQFVNNRYDITSTPVATMAVGTAAGTSPTVDNTVTSVWGNAARLKFTSGSSPTANGVVCTITLGTEYTFNECIPIMQGRSTNAGAFNYSCSYDSGTRVITCTLVGTLTASTVYEFNIIFLGRN